VFRNGGWLALFLRANGSDVVFEDGVPASISPLLNLPMDSPGSERICGDSLCDIVFKRIKFTVFPSSLLFLWQFISGKIFSHGSTIEPGYARYIAVIVSLVVKVTDHKKSLLCDHHCCSLSVGTERLAGEHFSTATSEHFYTAIDKRKALRNGYKSRTLKTRYGETTLQKPQFRNMPFETQIFGKYSRVEKALVNAIVESYLQGVSTRKIQDIVSHLGIEQLSPASVSRMVRDLDEQVQAFLTRSIEHKIPYLFVDASYFKVRDGVRYVNKAALIVAGIREDYRREVLGVTITSCENEDFWLSIFEDLKERGLDGVQMVVSDGHSGIQKAVEGAFLGTSWQMLSTSV
jgi:hypothetical protein